MSSNLVFSGNLCSGKGASVNTKPLLSLIEHAQFQLALRIAEVRQVLKYGGSDRTPFQTKLASDLSKGPITTERSVFKPIKCHAKEGTFFCASMDISIPDAVRELLAYQIDLSFGFGLVPPVIFRNIPNYGTGSLQAWVDAPSAGSLRRNVGYDYHKNLNNPWLHRLVAFDVLIGNVDRHAGNWLVGNDLRVYSIDNGYAFPKRNDCRNIHSLALSGLIGQPVSEDTKELIMRIKEDKLISLMSSYGFKYQEPLGVIRRLRYLKNLKQWEPVGRLQLIAK